MLTRLVLAALAGAGFAVAFTFAVVATLTRRALGGEP